MIISHRHRYLFIELPHTASTAISHELCTYYDGQAILHKHAQPFELEDALARRVAGYYQFASIRHPLDVAVTLYFKERTDHQGFFSTPRYWRRNGGHVTDRQLQRHRFIQETGADFSTYFLRFYRLPYDSYGTPSPHDFDFVVRYERLQEDFFTLLHKLDIPPERKLPWVNKTAEKEDDFWHYYTPETRVRVRRVFGPYLQLWDYDLPAGWGPWSVPLPGKALFHLLRAARRFHARLLWERRRHRNRI